MAPNRTYLGRQPAGPKKNMVGRGAATPFHAYNAHRYYQRHNEGKYIPHHEIYDSEADVPR